MVFFRIFQSKPALPIDVLIAKLDNLRIVIYESKTDVAIIETSSTFQDERKDSQSTLNKTTGTAESLETFASAPETPVDQDEDIKGTWKRLLSIISEKHPSLVANLKNSMIKTLADNRIEIEVNGSHFNVNMILRDKNKAIIKKICGDFFGKEMDIVIVPKKIKDPEHQEKKSQAGRLKQEALSHPLVTDALEIFNGNVVDVKIL